MCCHPSTATCSASHLLPLMRAPEEPNFQIQEGPRAMLRYPMPALGGAWLVRVPALWSCISKVLGLGFKSLTPWPPPCRIQPATSSILFWTDGSVFRTFAPLVTSKPHTPSLHLQVLTTMDLSAPNSNVSPSCFLHGVPALAYLNIVSHLSFTYLTHTCVVPPMCQHLC